MDPRRSVYLETFGCQMNELDSELVSGQLRALGYRFVGEPERAGVVLYNTCSVREHAEQKVWSRLGELAIRKRREPSLVVGVLGCLAERDGVDLMRRMPVVDVLCGPGELDKLPGLLDNAVRTRASLAAEGGAEASRVSAREVALQGSASRRSTTLSAAEDGLELLDLSRAISPVDVEGVARRSAYVRITRGCNKFCTYCVVPHTRGAEMHRPPEHIVEECRRLAESGVVEITLLGQTVNHYRYEHGAAVLVNGVSQPQKGRAHTGRGMEAGVGRVTTFADLLRMVHEAVPSVERLRFVTSYPRDFGDDALEAMRDCERICRYLHVPAQSGSDRILRLMNRGYEVGEYVEFVDRARAIVGTADRPLMLAGDFIVGFPTETEEDFEATKRLVERVGYKNAFIFKYSPRPGTAAYDRLADDVPDEVKRRRNNELLEVQGRISDAISRSEVGRVVRVLVEGMSAREEKRRAPGAGVGLTVNGSRVEDVESWASSGVATARGVQLTGRTEGDQIVFVESDRPEELVGRMVEVRIERADRLSLFGRVEESGTARRGT